MIKIIVFKIVVFKVHDNKLEKIDESIGELSLLQTLNLSHNELNTFNRINLLPKNFGHLDDLEDLVKDW